MRINKTISSVIIAISVLLTAILAFSGCGKEEPMASFSVSPIVIEDVEDGEFKEAILDEINATNYMQKNPPPKIT